MSILGTLYLFFFNVFFKLGINKYAAWNGSDEYVNVEGLGLDLFVNGVDVCNEVYNIFAWIDIFIDVDFCLNLFLLTTMYYTLKFTMNLAKFVIKMFK